ncbi:hypothetical protein NYR55_04945 [Sphingomonas sp. BGYR3]|uniref:hypothetical protein n=1 Tax=Sphingomonas sp. BGYR3 TaxID=2975483 RepID=UPI0021A57327|nr:hypothetical protein [Sphingomonas sp. BGYR3]MDG5487966.1 hypothetical protein [Sphingomonas sp. BGYR3]
MKITLFAAVAASALLPMPAMAQDQMDHGQHGQHQPSPTPAPAPAPASPDHAAMDHSAMDHGAMDHGGHAMHPAMMNAGSGTARLPDAEPMRAIHAQAGGWGVMIHGFVFGAVTDQSGPRGDSQLYAPSMAMLMADRALNGRTQLQLRLGMSADPTMGARGYPNLFTTGETANGEALIDRQHPHDLFMELAARVDVALGETNDTRLFVYGGPVGEPALGPSAFMHRRSAQYLALGPITHHWFDSTHIAYGVVTGGIAAKRFQVEASAFRGREPDEERWGIETPALDSWSVRATWVPNDHWAAQVSFGRLKAPEALHPDEDEARTTASVHYATRNVNATLAFSSKNRLPGPVLTAWLAEANWNLTPRHSLFGRYENVANDELFPEGDPLHGRPFRVAKLESGYAHRILLTRDVELAMGGSVATYFKPDALDTAYGRDPLALTGFLKLTVGQ